MAKIDVSGIHPFDKMKVMTVDSQEVVYIPNTWIRNTPLPKGTKYEDKVAYMFADGPKDGYHLAPSFYTNGVQNENGVQLSAYIASKDSSGKAASIAGATPWTGIAYTAIDAAAKTRNTGTGEQAGWRAWNIYDHHLLARLMLFEAGSADIQTIIGGTDGSIGVTYHDIHDVWDGTSYGFFIYGLTTTGSGYRIAILDNKGKGTMIDTNIAPCGIGWPVTLLDNTGDGYDLGDAFLAKTVTDTEGSGTLGDNCRFSEGYAFFTYYGDSSTYHGPFSLNRNGTSVTNGSLGFRLARSC